MAKINVIKSNAHKENIGKQITSHKQLEALVKSKTWIVLATGKVITHHVAAYFVNGGYLKLCSMIRNKKLFEYKKNK